MSIKSWVETLVTAQVDGTALILLSQKAAGDPN